MGVLPHEVRLENCMSVLQREVHLTTRRWLVFPQLDQGNEEVLSRMEPKNREQAKESLDSQDI
jgi:hypothetical protein